MPGKADGEERRHLQSGVDEGEPTEAGFRDVWAEQVENAKAGDGKDQGKDCAGDGDGEPADAEDFEGEGDGEVEDWREGADEVAVGRLAEGYAPAGVDEWAEVVAAEAVLEELEAEQADAEAGECAEREEAGEGGARHRRIRQR